MSPHFIPMFPHVSKLMFSVSDQLYNINYILKSNLGWFSRCNFFECMCRIDGFSKIISSLVCIFQHHYRKFSLDFSYSADVVVSLRTTVLISDVCKIIDSVSL